MLRSGVEERTASTVGKIMNLTLLVAALALSACTPASPTAEPPTQTVIPGSTQAPSMPPAIIETGAPTPTETAEPSPIATHLPTSTPVAPTATPLPQIHASCYPDASAPLEDLVVLKGPEHLFDPSCQVSGGVGQIAARWDIDRDGSPESTHLDPPPLALQPGEYNPVVDFTDQAGQSLTVKLPRIVKVGEPKYPDWTLGVMEHLNNTFGVYPDAQSIEAAANLMSDARIPAVRVDFEWADIELHRGTYRWERYDALVSILVSAGVNVVPILTYSPQWATDGNSKFSSPTSPDDFGAFVGALARRYRDRIDVYQIWQEANTSLYFDPPDPDRYSELLNIAYLNVKYYDPGAVVVMAGLANDASAAYPGTVFIPPEDFLRALYENEALFDVVARHPFTHPLETLDTLRQRMQTIRQTMSQHGDNYSQLWVTEYTASTNLGHPGGLSEEEQASWLSQSLRVLLNEHLADKVFWYNLRDTVVDSDPFFAYSGLVHHDLTPKPAWYSFCELVNRYP